MSKNPSVIVSNDADTSSTPSSTSRPAHENGDTPLTTPLTPLSEPRASLNHPQPTADSFDASTQRSSLPATSSTVKGMSQKAHLNGSAPQKQPSAQSPTFLEKLLHFLLPCISPSSAAHPVELQEPVIANPEPEKQVTKAVEPEKPPPSQVTLPNDPSRTDLPKPTIVTSHSRPVTPIGEDADVVLPPTPTTQLLPPDETEGMTSGAVQPPGSKGDSPLHEKLHHAPTHTNGDGEESETSYEEELDDQEDEEDRLILNGGAGIPMGPVSCCAGSFASR
jgi:RNA polymerase II subunit A small phosphatase-like protein